MTDWNSKTRSPDSIWKTLSKENPKLEKDYFKLPDGRWDISRLNNALMTYEQEKIKTENLVKNSSQTRQYESQQMQQELILSNQIQQIQNQYTVIQKEKSNKVSFEILNIAIGLYFFSAIIQAVVVLLVGWGEARIVDTYPLIILSCIMAWISIPLMSKSLATQIKKLDRR
jgi:CRISPR/Cas system CMR subunit Cmr6 (Cas7 group RAMP superfamily)